MASAKAMGVAAAGLRWRAAAGMAASLAPWQDLQPVGQALRGWMGLSFGSAPPWPFPGGGGDKTGDTVPVLATQLNSRSADFQANAAAMQVLVDDLNAQIAVHAAGGGEAARRKHESRGKLPPRERVQMLLDPGTPFLEI